MTIEKRKYFLGAPIPFTKIEASKNDEELISPRIKKFNGKIIELTVDSQDSISCIQDISEKDSPPGRSTISRYLKKEAINKADVQIRHTLFTSYRYKWKRN